ncbi:branched-chain amino acid ABC transporter permease [Dactylosporangium sp. NPDC051485]|uniref:branched-chain amino acid ABC transporter permease n=1 Tax=Dactylosporangium sp. NPDC051485 TaxID=3154846 RepID=UPI003422F50D
MAGDLIVALDGVAFGLLLYCVAAGLSLSLGVAGVFQLSHGALYLAGACLAWWFAAQGTWLGFVVALLVGLATGAAAGGGLAELLRHVPDHLDQALVTIGAGLILVEVLTSGYGAQARTVLPPPGLDGAVTLLGRAYPVYRLTIIAVAAVLSAALHLTVERSRPGVLVRAVAADPRHVATLGVEPRRVHLAVMMAGGALAVFAGVLGAPILGPAPGLDTTVLTLSLIIIVAGGLGSMRGALLAALIVGQVHTSVAVAWPTAAPFLLAALLLVGLAWRTHHHLITARVA